MNEININPKFKLNEEVYYFTKPENEHVTVDQSPVKDTVKSYSIVEAENSIGVLGYDYVYVLENSKLSVKEETLFPIESDIKTIIININADILATLYEKIDKIENENIKINEKFDNADSLETAEVKNVAEEQEEVSLE